VVGHTEYRIRLKSYFELSIVACVDESQFRVRRNDLKLAVPFPRYWIKVRNNVDTNLVEDGDWYRSLPRERGELGLRRDTKNICNCGGPQQKREFPTAYAESLKPIHHPPPVVRDIGSRLPVVDDRSWQDLLPVAASY
jgi:hypothetical protein